MDKMDAYLIVGSIPLLLFTTGTPRIYRRPS